MATRRITANTAITYNQVQASDVLLVGKTSVDRKITLPQTKKYVLQNNTIGGSGANDLVTNTAEQTLTNKTLTNPIINGSLCQVQGSDLNKLLNIDTTQAQLNRLAGLTVNSDKLNYTANVSSDIQSQLNSKVTRYGTTEYVLYNYHKIKTLSGATSDTIPYTDILTYHSLSSTTYRINAYSIMVQVWDVNTGTEARTYKADATISFTSTVDGSKLNLNTITIGGLDDEKTYQFNVSFTVNSYSGGS